MHPRRSALSASIELSHQSYESQSALTVGTAANYPPLAEFAMKSRALLVIAAACVALSPIPAASQDLSGQIGQLISFGSCGTALCIVTGPGLHAGHYLKSAESAGAELVSFLTGSITAGVGRLPISATSSGNTVSLVNGALVQGTTSSGPVFAERASTLGKGRALLGITTTGINYSKLRGQSISGLNFNLAHEDVLLAGLGDSPNERDVIGINLDLTFKLQVTAISASYGLSDKMDLSLSVPIVMASLNGTATGRVYGDTVVTGNHYFDSPNTYTKTSKVSGSKTGIGDIAARLKYSLTKTEKSGMALLFDLRLPTGDAANFTGSGKFGGNAMIVASSTYGKFSPHANVGYAVRNGEGQNNALLGTLGFDQLITNQATIAVDLLSEFQASGDAGALPADFTIRPVGKSINYRGSNIETSKDNPISLSAGGRFVFGDYSVLVNGVIPIKSGGLQSNLIWTLGAARRF